MLINHRKFNILTFTTTIIPFNFLYGVGNYSCSRKKTSHRFYNSLRFSSDEYYSIHFDRYWSTYLKEIE